MLILSIETLYKIRVYVMDWRDFVNLYALKKPWKLEKNKIGYSGLQTMVQE